MVTRTPNVSVLIPQWGNTDYTERAVAAVRRSDYSAAIEVLVWDNASPGGPGGVSQRDDVTVLTSEENIGFGPAINRLAEKAAHELLLILNNDTVLAPSALRWLAEAASRSGGPVTPQYRDFSGAVLEMGGSVGEAGRAAQVFHHAVLPTSLSRMPFEAAYGSAGCMMIPREVFERYGGFDDGFAPAYYEDTDLCIRLAKDGVPTTVEPRAIVYHNEGTTSGRDVSSGPKAQQVRNRSRLVERHDDWLRGKGAPGLGAAMRRLTEPAAGGLRVLWLGSVLPRGDRDGGGRRIESMLRTLRATGNSVVFHARSAHDADQYGARLESLGIPWFGGSHPSRWSGDERPLSRLDEIDDLLTIVPWDLIVVSFARHFRVVRRRLEEHVPDVPIVIDNGDLHFLRHERGRAIGLEIDDSLDKEQELDAYAAVAGVITSSAPEDRILRDELPTLPTFVYTVAAPEPVEARPVEGSSGVMFLGNFGHPPNVDAVEWWVQEIGPRLNELVGRDVRLRIVGAGTDGAFNEMSKAQLDLLDVHGWMPDLRPAFTSARVFAAPLRYGAGTKGKVLDALAFGTPTVTTSIGAEGFPDSVRNALIVVDDANGFAAAVADLLADDHDWYDRHERSLAAAREVHQAQVAQREALQGWLTERSRSGVDWSPHPRLSDLSALEPRYEKPRAVRRRPRATVRTSHIEVCPDPIFVVGAPRSGTSMMQHSLRQHPGLWGGEESDFMIPLLQGAKEAHEYGVRRGDLHWLSSQGVAGTEFLRHVGYGINALYTDRSGGLRWVEQTPQYTLHLDDLNAMFPGARFLFMLRDGRSVVHSLRHFVNPVQHDRACRIWKRFTEAGLNFKSSDSGDRVMVVPYEEIVAETDRVLREIYAFLDMPFEAASVDFIRSNSPINSSFTGERTAREKIVPRWEAWSPDERETFDRIAGDLLVELGFEQDRRWVRQEVSP